MFRTTPNRVNYAYFVRSGQASEEAFEAFGKEAVTYEQNYSHDAGRYPDHVYRLRIFQDLLAALRPTTVLDAGCGSGVPLVTLLDSGYDAYGFDRSPDMVATTRQRLASANHSPTRVFEGDLDKFTNPIGKPFDAIVGLGSVYYTPDTSKTIRVLTEQVRDDGAVIFSLRNQLFSLCSLNEYSADFLLKEIYPIQATEGKVRNELIDFFAARFPKLDINKLFDNVDERNIRSKLHNPLTVEVELLIPNGLVLTGLYYYHFHALPPIFEHTHQQLFYELSSEREIPTDWRGLVSASCFVVHATKQR